MKKVKQILGRYVDINTDFGWKFYFGREENKGLLIQFLNDIFQGEKVIQDLIYVTPEQDGDYEEDRRVIFDLHCIADDGEHFIIEMQQIYQDFFKDRALFYTSRLISKQIQKGRLGDKYKLPEIYFIGILEFSLQDTDTEQYFIDVGLMDKVNKKMFYTKLGFKFIVLPHFNKKENELCNDMEQWLYLLKNLSTMKGISKYLDRRVFGRIFDVGEVAKLKREDQMSYEASLKRKWDWESVLSTTERIGKEEGRKEGRKEGREEFQTEIIESLIVESRLSDEDIARITKVSLTFVQQVREKLKTR
ncbi:Rpn family recombination-promoting nuclease/putative transposase [Sphingobacterium sp. MYb382]|uniref:Rpn family recombination-promoting nuclease/putative transposase n=1 Tax=Sphingobacterium sp. MYb382 TaxID=2745278 RepID=UPI003096FBBB